MSIESTIFTGVACYLVLMLIIGAWASKRTGSTENFIVAGRRMPIWIASATLVATWFGGGSIMGAGGAAYDDGMLGVIADPFGAAMVFFIVGFFFVRIFRRLKLLTVIDFLENRFGRTVGLIAACGLFASNIGWTGAMLVAFGLIFQSLTGVPMEWGILGGALVVFIYTVAGGMWAVALTDFVQMLIIAFGLIMLLIVVLIDVGGWGAIAPRLPEGTFRMIPAVPTWEAWSIYLRAWFIFGLADTTAQTLMQRAFSAKNEQVAQNSFYIAGLTYILLGMVPVMLGIIASVTMPGISDSESMIPELAVAHLHPVAVAIFVGALLAAIMSSADSALLATASIFSVNIMPLFTRKEITDRARLLATRIAIPVIGILAVIVALQARVVFDLMQDANSFLLVSAVVPFACGIWWRKANRSGALASMIAGFATWFLALIFAPQLAGDLLGLGACLVVMFVVTPLTQKSDPPRPLRDSDGRIVEMTNRLGTLPLFRRVAQSDDRASQAGVS
ncbi:MAG: sodium:solute symporter family protein [Woeseiaceae bacterium]|nr:sodium:solute symporter family protein [Woeseiaceae bacterium]